MANLSVAAGYKVNGVAKLHSEILKQTVFADQYRIMPEKFTNVTNGIAHRRWLCQSNPELCKLLDSLIGKGYVKDASQLKKLLEFKDDSAVLEKLEKIKHANKVKLANTVKKLGYGDIDPDSVFDIQVKRLHEYKRQHLNALHIIDDYLFIKNNPNADFTPKTYIFGAKAASGYYLAKQIIQLISKLGQLINNDPDCKDKLKVIYIEDYRVTLAEIIIPAADVSEQISLAGTEASGTSNMKFMINGAVTLGTEDGANVEIHEAVGDDNIVIFGMRDYEVDALRARGYYPQDYYNNNNRIANAINFIKKGICSTDFTDLAATMLNNDYYMALADFADYCEAQEKISRLYNDRNTWNKISLTNIANAGIFSIDRLIEDYANNIWNLKKVDRK